MRKTLLAVLLIHVDTFASQFSRTEDRAVIAEGLRKAGLK